ncbi:MAG: hypothetical protein HY319_06035 [Armatimonadetes bacterium]|nr:hypothetical protein [Armatimonadota bacterium]
MNTLDILYQVFRARHSLVRVQERLERGSRLALIGPEGWPEKLSSYLGEPVEHPEGGSGLDRVLILRLPLDDSARESLSGSEAAIVHLGKELPQADELRNVAGHIPVEVPCLWVTENEDDVRFQALAATADLTVPSVRRLDPKDPASALCRLMMAALPDVALAVAREFTRARSEYARRLVQRSASRNAVIAAASSLPVGSVPVIGFFLSFLATTGETLAITASQLRLCLMMAALHGRPLDFFDRVSELWPVVGSAFGWRQLARELVGRVPVAGWAMKAAVAYSGTWMVGEGSRRFYELGAPTDEEIQRDLARRSRREAMRAAEEYLASIREGMTPEEEPDPFEEAEDQKGEDR